MLQNLLHTISDIDIESIDYHPEEAVKKVCLYKPDLVFVAVVMSNLTGFEVIKNIRNQNVFPSFVLVTAFPEYAVRAIKEEVFDYLVKPVDIDELKQCIKRYLGENHINRFSIFIEKKLSNREKEVLQQICKGKTSREIATDLFISKTTVDTHRKNIIKKIGCKNISELIAKYSS
ncbi:MAG: response regulator transcription factor [Bacteroidetes bacterium]|jgi:DNA-binding NarL/FixJ family response regulator|nr:response regulator transcription factor [Bacteroidota bacterium]